MDAVSSGDGYDAEPMSMDMVGDIRDCSKSHLIINRRESRYNINNRIKQGQVEWKIELLSTQNMGKGLHKVFKAVIMIFFKLYQF